MALDNLEALYSKTYDSIEFLTSCERGKPFTMHADMHMSLLRERFQRIFAADIPENEDMNEFNQFKIPVRANETDEAAALNIIAWSSAYLQLSSNRFIDAVATHVKKMFVEAFGQGMKDTLKKHLYELRNLGELAELMEEDSLLAYWRKGLETREKKLKEAKRILHQARAGRHEQPSGGSRANSEYKRSPRQRRTIDSAQAPSRRSQPVEQDCPGQLPADAKSEAESDDRSSSSGNGNKTTRKNKGKMRIEPKLESGPKHDDQSSKSHTSKRTVYSSKQAGRRNAIIENWSDDDTQPSKPRAKRITPQSLTLRTGKGRPRRAKTIAERCTPGIL